MRHYHSLSIAVGILALSGALYTAAAYAQDEVEIWVANEEEFFGTQILDGDLNFLVGDETGGIPGSTEHTHIGDFTSDFGTYYSANVGEGDAVTTSVDVIDANTRQIIASVGTAGRSHAVIVSPDDRWAIVNNLNDNTQLIDTISNAVVNTIPIGDGPGGINDRPVCVATSANSKKIYHAAALTDKVIVITIDPVTGQEVAVQKAVPEVENACGLLRSKNNKALYVLAGRATGTGNAGANTFHVIDIRTDTKIFSIGTTGDDAHAIAETPNGKEIWIGNRDSGTIEIRDGRSPDYDLIEVINLADPQHGLGPGIHKPDLFGFSPNGKAFYSILREPDNMVIKIDVATRTVVGSRFMGGEPHGLRVRALSD